MSGGDRRDGMIRLVKGAAIAAKSYQAMRDALLRG